MEIILFERLQRQSTKLGRMTTTTISLSLFYQMRIFVGTEEAKHITDLMPKGKAFVASSTSQIPSLLREVFLAAVTK